MFKCSLISGLGSEKSTSYKGAMKGGTGSADPRNLSVKTANPNFLKFKSEMAKELTSTLACSNV